MLVARLQNCTSCRIPVPELWAGEDTREAGHTPALRKKRPPVPVSGSQASREQGNLNATDDINRLPDKLIRGAHALAQCDMGTRLQR